MPSNNFSAVRLRKRFRLHTNRSFVGWLWAISHAGGRRSVFVGVLVTPSKAHLRSKPSGGAGSSTEVIILNHRLRKSGECLNIRRVTKGVGGHPMKNPIVRIVRIEQKSLGRLEHSQYHAPLE